MNAHEWALAVGLSPLLMALVWVVCMIFYIAWEEAGFLGLAFICGYIGYFGLVMWGLS